MIKDLFIDTTNSCLALIYMVDNKIIDSFLEFNQNRASDSINNEINLLLSKNDANLSEIDNYYIIKGPGSYTGVKVGIMIGLTAKAVNDNVNVHLLSSLQFLASKKKAVTLIDAKSNKSYIGVYDINNELFPDQILDNSIIETFINDVKKSLGDFELFNDYSKVDHLNNFVLLKNHFYKCNSIDEIEPLYIKKAI